MLYCSSEAIEAYKFNIETIEKESVSTILQSTLNNMNGQILGQLNLKAVHRFYNILEKKFSLQLGRIVVALSSKSELKTLMARKVPYLTRFAKQINDCTEMDKCKETESIMKDLPGKFINPFCF